MEESATTESKIEASSLANRVQSFLCSKPSLRNVWSSFLILFSAYCVLWSLTGDLMLPWKSSGYLFTIFLIYIVAIFLSKLTVLLKMPGLVGMLIAGIIVRQLPVPVIESDSAAVVSSSLRNSAFAVILIRAGLSLDLASILRLKRTVFMLALIPGCVVEASVVAIASYLLLGFSLIWGFILGFVLAAVSPAVVVPSLIALQEKGLGVEQGIPSLVIAAASLDDIFAILGFSLALDICMATGDSSSYVMLVVELVAGVVVGVFLGFLVLFLPPSKGTNSISVKPFFITILLICIAFVLGASRLDARGAGPLSCLIFAVIIGRKDSKTSEVMESWFKQLWLLLMPFLFGLIGYEVDIVVVMNTRALLCVLVIAIGLVFRVVASYLCTFGTELNWKEMLFVAIAWSPKATVQAAIGSVPLDYVISHNVDTANFEKFARDVLTSAVLAILITAPLGAIAIQISGLKLLSSSSSNKTEPQLEDKADNLKIPESVQSDRKDSEVADDLTTNV